MNFRIFTNAHSFMLEKERLVKAKNGERKFKYDYWYFPTLKQCIQKYEIEALLSDETAVTLFDIKMLLKRINENIEKIPNIIHKAKHYE